MISAYTHYFQKSKIFLYPLLGISKGKEYVPTETYLCWDGLYTVDDCKYICIYNTKRDKKYKLFENNVLKHLSNYESSFSLHEDRHVYIFDYSEYKHDYEMFIKGMYSKLSLKSKNKILDYFGEVGKISSYIKSYLNPEKYHDVYAEALLVHVDLIKEVYEICSTPDIKKETLFEKIPNECLMFENKSIYLEKTNQ